MKNTDLSAGSYTLLYFIYKKCAMLFYFVLTTSPSATNSKIRYTRKMNVIPLEDTIPVIIVAGFLGSGKTTLLNHLLRTNNGQKIGVIVNDFGETNIDSLLVSRWTENTIELSGGCICCQTEDGDLEQSLSMLAHQGSTIDAIIIEASGIAEPIDLKKLILYSPNKYVRFGGVVYVVDACNISSIQKKHPEINAHLASSDLIVVNKIDTVSNEQVEASIASIKELCPNVPIIKTSQGKVDSKILFDQPIVQEAQQLTLGAQPEEATHNHDHDHDHEHEHNHLHDSYTSVSFHTDKPLSPKRFQAMLENLTPEIYRLKAILYYGMKGFEQKVIVHKVGGHVSQYAEEWPEHETPSSDIVAIGIGIDTHAVMQLFEECIDPNPDDITPDDMIDIMRLKGY